ncbi:YjjG family noncanonical pyrimidine nucleotidase [Flavobacterium sp. 20NA77.7]|uniref:YjjG family noncanonical pyrimidine nucleotidase n=1 Tax=Flavobacterium nakdongensis TaxID=3073563 RepID=A0ABY9R931_9FLAO|nr:YjjG family noncanonical pyrimidine nucleotidase [Flavobacterium sp. 20NA77.7]WMW77476.1 YjjG family noncanonical pyrimidine nucleotidase [Flavobacterium sp. 20NA77.7]
MNPIKHIFFDLDHTLWDFDKNAELAFERIFVENRIDLPIKKFIEVYNPINQAYWKLYQVNEVSHETLRYGRLKDSFDSCKLTISDELLFKISDDFISYLPLNNHLIEGTLETLNYLQANYQLHIITNGFAHVQESKMINANLNRFFKTITNSEMAGHKKPHQTIFQYALKEANAQKHESIMIGDSWEADVEGALNFGMKVIYFNPNSNKLQRQVLQIEKLIELQNIL